MQRQTRRPLHNPVRTTILTLALLGALAALLGASSASASPKTKTVAKTATVAALDKTVLTTNRGRTLYSLSAETKGRFICTGACLASWKPLVVPKGVKPVGPAALGTRTRPDGRIQVTFKGLPLYSFSGDTKMGEANGEGIKDVGTWHAAKVAISPQGAPQPESPAPTSPYPSDPTPTNPYPSNPYPSNPNPMHPY
jgi:predicted lipoprotein with Yx(FWY)xxD motif